jgi:hypothetical protein
MRERGQLAEIQIEKAGQQQFSEVTVLGHDEGFVKR